MSSPVVRRILVPVDLAESRQPDLAYAMDLAAQLRAELVLLAVVDTPTVVQLVGRHRAAQRGGSAQGPGRDFEQELMQEVRSILQGLVDKAAGLGVKALGHVTFREEVEEQILKEALVQKVDLIVVRASGRTGFMKLLLGNTAGEILKAAPCPVLVAKV